LRPAVSAQQLGQPGNASSDAPRLIASEQIRSRASAGLILAIDED
jgi:hypothetical protein